MDVSLELISTGPEPNDEIFVAPDLGETFTEYHDLHTGVPVELNLVADGQYLVFDCEVDPDDPVTSRTRSVSRPRFEVPLDDEDDAEGEIEGESKSEGEETEDGESKRVDIREVATSTLRLPRGPLDEAGFKEKLENGEPVHTTFESKEPGKFTISFSPPVTPIRILSPNLDQQVKRGDESFRLKNPITGEGRTLRPVAQPDGGPTLQPDVGQLQKNRDGNNLENVGYRCYIKQHIDRAYGGLTEPDETVYGAFNLAFYQGHPALVLEIGTDLDDDRPHVHQFFSHTISDTHGDDVDDEDRNEYGVSYITYPRDYIAMLGWEDKHLVTFPMEDHMVIIPNEAAPADLQSKSDK